MPRGDHVRNVCKHERFNLPLLLMSDEAEKLRRRSAHRFGPSSTVFNVQTRLSLDVTAATVHL